MLTRFLFFRPFSRWPLLVHFACAAGVVALAVLAAWAGVLRAQQRTVALRQQVAAQELVQQQRATALQAATTALPDFTHSLPERTVADDVLRDMGRHAASQGVSLGAIAVSHQEPSLRELGKVQFTVTANAQYPKAKAWLAELLARYPSLAVQTLSVRAGSAADVARQEWQTVLTLYVKG
jgi:HAMP domain-containing protein